jgi:hypothetical protein
VFPTVQAVVDEPVGEVAGDQPHRDTGKLP